MTATAVAEASIDRSHTMTRSTVRDDPFDGRWNRVRRRRHGVIAIAILSLLGASCGDDAADTSATSATAGTGVPTSEPNGTPETKGDPSEFCQAAIDGEALFTAGPELGADGNPTPDSMEAFSTQINPALDSIEANAPDEIADNVDTLLTGVRAALEGGDESITETPEFFEADAAIDAYVYDNCALVESHDIIAVDYGYEGVPETMEPGQTGIRMDNQGDEVHEAVILRINDDVGLSVDELLELPEDEVEQVTEFRGVVFAPPGDQASAVIDLEAGRHVMICVIPVGTTSLDEAGPQDGSGGPPHLVRGMVQAFDVV